MIYKLYNKLFDLYINKAETTGMNPLYLMIPATIHCNYAFMLPAGTPPNSMVLEAGKIEPSHLVFFFLNKKFIKTNQTKNYYFKI